MFPVTGLGVEVPTTREPGLVRPRLLNELASLRTAKLALVVAPAGAGKTTLLAHYAARYDGPVGWWHVGPTDTTAAAVVARLWQAVPGLRVDNVAPPAHPDDLLAAMAAAPPTDRLLIIDDLHCLACPDAEAALEAVVARAPTWLHVLAGGRRMPAFNLSRHELAGVRVLDAERLRFRAWEVEYLLRDVYREPLPPDDAAALARRVGGWAAGLHMFHLSTRDRPLPERRRAVAALDGRSTLTRGYLARTVLAELPADLREFLVRTCVFDVLTARRCDRLLAADEATAAYAGTSGQRLAELERRQAFTASNDGGATYRYHEVLRAHLAATLTEELGDAGARDWYARAAALLAGEDAHVEAARAYARAENWSAVRVLLDRLGANVAAEGVALWRDVLPAWLVAEDPWLLLAEGRHRLGRGQLDAAIECFRRAEGLFTDERSRSRCRAVRWQAATWLPGPETAPGGHATTLLREATRRHPALVAASALATAGPAARQADPVARQANPAAHRGDLGTRQTDPAARRGDLGTRQTDPATRQADPVARQLVRAVASLLAGDVVAARRVLRAEPDDAGPVGLAVRLLRAAVAVADRDPAGHPARDRVIADAERAELPWLVRMGRAVAVLDGSDAGAAEARAVVAECDRDADHWGATLARALVCLARSVTGGTHPDEAADLVRRARQLGAGTLDAWAQALLALAAAAAGLPDAELEAQRAESLARSAGVPGARVAALAAATRCAPAGTGGTRVTADAGNGAGHTGGAGEWAGTGGEPVRLAGECGLPVAVVAGWAGVGAPRRLRVVQAAPVEVWCFGGFRIRRHGRPLDTSSIKPRTRTALRLLAMHGGRPVHRESMIEALWPDLPPAAATRNLHVALSSLRSLLEPGGPSLLRDGDAYELAVPPDGYSDVAVFADALDAAHRARLAGDAAATARALRRAMLAYGGDLLPEDGPAEWVVRERDVLRRRAADAAAELAGAELTLGGWSEAAGAAERCVQIDPYCDAGWRLLIDAYERQGELAAATRARRDYADVLASLGVEVPAPAQPRPTGQVRTTGEGPGRAGAADRASVRDRHGSAAIPVQRTPARPVPPDVLAVRRTSTGS